MGHIYNKSLHPVEVKRISVRMWALRDEIEAAITRRLRECEASGIPLNIEDIQRFYGLHPDRPLGEQAPLQLVPEGDEGAGPTTDNVDAMMETITPEAEAETAPAAEPEAPAVEAAAPSSEEGAPTDDAPADAIKTADAIIAGQDENMKKQGPNPMLLRPYERQAPDTDKISYGFSLISDVNMDWILMFSRNSFVQGQSVVVEFLIPRPFMMSAEVTVCNHYAMRSRIISQTKPDFRLQCRFTFQIPGERTRLREFLTSVEPTLPIPKRAAAKKEDDAGPADL